MSFTCRTAQLLHEDHQATVGVIEDLDRIIARAKRSLPDINDPAVKATLTKAAASISDEVSRHFSFEEDELFTMLEEMGDAQIGAHLREEHAILLPLGNQVASLARAALSEGFSEIAWKEFRAKAVELIERMITHIQKEEMALLPVLEELLDPETDLALSTAYNESH
ncbi:MAG: hemerythrin domain-containing protein [Hyphomicrobiales bacterium]|nr:hemerythrin domain-containing protein [Hyphomicrobiales bacterium]